MLMIVGHFGRFRRAVYLLFLASSGRFWRAVDLLVSAIVAVFGGW